MRPWVDQTRSREGSRDLIRGRITASRPLPAKRQQPMGSSSPTVSNDTVDCSGGDGVDANAPMVRWKKGKVRALKWRLSVSEEAPGEVGGSRSEGEEEGDPFRQMLSTTTATSLTSRRGVRLHGKVAEDSDAVDPAPVPRKLRSAINKRSSQSSSPVTPYAKKKHQNTSNGFQVLHGNGRKRCTKSVLFGSLTKDEEEVVEALCALSRMLPIGEQIPDKEDSRVLEDHQDNNATPATRSEALKVEDKSLLQQCATCEIRSPSSCTEKPLEETLKDGHPPCKQSNTVCGRQTVDSDLKRTPEPVSHIIPLSENEHPKRTPFGNLMNLSSPSGVLPHYYNGNRLLQPTQCDAIAALPPYKSDMLQQNGCVGSTALGLDIQQEEHNSESSAKPVYAEGTVLPHIQPPNNSAGWPGRATSTARLSSSRIDLPTKKVPLDVTSTWKKCAIHVSIGHLIKTYQDNEKQRTPLLSFEDLESKDGSKLCVPANNERAGLQSGLNGVASAAINGSTVGRNRHEGRNEILCSGRFMPAHQSSVLFEAKQKQTSDFLPLPTGGDAISSANGVKSPGQLLSPFLHAQVPHHSLVPFPFPHVPYSPHYPEKIVPAATQQVQLQVPRYVGNPFYGPRMDNAMGNIQMQQQYQQQQIWQAHFAHYRTPVGVIVPQNERLHDSSPSMCQSAKVSSTISPSPSMQMQGGSYHPPIFRQKHKILANASSLPSSKAKPHQHQ